MTRVAPKVPGHLLFGNLLDFRSSRIEFLQRATQDFGDIARVRFGVISGLLVSSAEIAHEVLVEKNSAFMKGFGLSIFAKPLLGDGLLTSEGDFHKKQRRLVAPAFMQKRIAEYATTIALHTEIAAARLEERDTVNLAEEMMELTFEIVGKALFNADVSGDSKGVGNALTEAMKHMMDSLASFLPIPPAVPTPRHLRARKVIQRLDDVVYRIIRERRASGNDEGDFLSMLLLAQDEEDGSSMSDKQVRDEAMTIILAGHETTANALAWTFYLLSRHGDARERLEAEVDTVLAGRTPTLADLPKLPFTLAVFKEAMRLYPPAYIVARRALNDVSLCGYEAKKNTIVMINIIGMHRREKYFEHPDDFDPSRFLPERERTLTKHCFIPFGGGPRICIGNHFALMEGQMILAQLTQRFRFNLLSADPVIPDPLVTLRPGGGIPVRIEKRPPTPSSRKGPIGECLQ